MTTVVIGASLAGFKVAQELRRHQYADEIVLIGEESHQPYDRPPLSKGLLSGTVEADTLQLASPASYAELAIELRLGVAVTDVDLGARRLRTSDGTWHGYQTLVIAAGARPRRLPALESFVNVHYLRTIDDATALRERLPSIARLAVVGGGLIGGEAAATARRLGIEVTVIDVLERPFHRTLGAYAGSLIEEHHRDMGVTFACGAPIAGYAGDASVEEIHLADGRVIATDAVLVGVGVVPNVEFLDRSGLDLADGVLCDATGRCGEAVWAVGDIARWDRSDGLTPRRFEHWSNAVDHARAVAWNIVAPEDGARRHAAGIPYFWTDQYDHKVQVFGTPAAADEFVPLTSDPDPFKLSGVFCRDGRVAAGIAINAVREVPAVRRLVADATPASDLADAVAIREGRMIR